jgi:hypothetical protein
MTGGADGPNAFSGPGFFRPHGQLAFRVGQPIPIQAFSGYHHDYRIPFYPRDGRWKKASVVVTIWGVQKQSLAEIHASFHRYSKALHVWCRPRAHGVRGRLDPRMWQASSIAIPDHRIALLQKWTAPPVEPQHGGATVLYGCV